MHHVSNFMTPETATFVPHLEGSFSALSTPIIWKARSRLYQHRCLQPKFYQILILQHFRDLQDLHSFAPLRSPDSTHSSKTKLIEKMSITETKLKVISKQTALLPPELNWIKIAQTITKRCGQFKQNLNFIEILRKKR